MEEYKNIHPAFEGTREQKLIEVMFVSVFAHCLPYTCIEIQALHEAFEEGLEDKFAQLVCKLFIVLTQVHNCIVSRLKIMIQYPVLTIG